MTGTSVEGGAMRAKKRRVGLSGAATGALGTSGDGGERV